MYEALAIYLLAGHRPEGRRAAGQQPLGTVLPQAVAAIALAQRSAAAFPLLRAKLARPDAASIAAITARCRWSRSPWRPAISPRSRSTLKATCR